MLTRSIKAAAADELHPYLDALRGGEQYLRAVESQIRRPKEKRKEIKPRKDAGARRALGRDAKTDRAAVNALASRFERELGISKGVLVRALHAYRLRFKSLLESWIRCRPDAAKWREENPAAWKEIERTAAQIRFKPFASRRGFELMMERPLRRASFDQKAEFDAKRLFLEFVTRPLPLQERLRLCPRCVSFYVAGRSDQKSCSTRCATALTARKANQDRRDRERKSKLKRVRAEALKIAARRRLTPDWKKRLAEKTGVTPTFIQRNRDDLKLPARFRTKGRGG